MGGRLAANKAVSGMAEFLSFMEACEDAHAHTFLSPRGQKAQCSHFSIRTPSNEIH